MAPNYESIGGFTVDDALAHAGAPDYGMEYQLGEPPVNFFTHPPKNAAAAFSTVCGTQPFRMVQNPTFERDGCYWWAAQIQCVCDELRRNLPQVCKYIEPLQSYWDLYKYFDAYEIYYRGAQNLWNVIHTLHFENMYAHAAVQAEQQAQANQRAPLFEIMAAKVLKAPGMQAKLLTWDIEKQQIHELFTPWELHAFEGYDKYHEQYVGTIRTIFARHYETLRQGLPLCLNVGSSAGQASTSGRDNDSYLSQLADLKSHLNVAEGLDDPFMDKFEIPNRIINGIVIADGTSRTAALKARQESIAAAGRGSQQGDGNFAMLSHNVSKLPPNVASTGSPCSDLGATKPAACPVSTTTTARCTSAPSIGGDPASILGTQSAEEARVYPGGSHEVDQKLTGYQRPDGLVDASGYPPMVGNEAQVAMPEAGSNNMPFPSALNHNQPVESRDRCLSQAINRRRSSGWQPGPPFIPPPAPGAMVSSHPQHPRGRGMTLTFANQIPEFMLAQQHNQGPPGPPSLPPPAPPPPFTMQQNQCPPHGYFQSNGGFNAPNSMAPNFQQGARVQNNRPPANTEARTTQHKNNAGSGTWHHVGCDDIHGPKVVYRKGSAYGQEAQYGTGQTQYAESSGHGRQLSIASMTSGYNQFGNNRPNNFNNPGCVNAAKRLDKYTKFDPCQCKRCKEKDRSIHVIGLPEENLDLAIKLAEKYFATFGSIEAVTPTTSFRGQYRALRIRYYNVQSVLDAIQAGPPAIDGLGSIKASFSIGSQFFTPIKGYRHESNSHGYNTQNHSQTERMASHRTSVQGQNNNFNHAQSQPGRSQVPSFGVSVGSPIASAVTGQPSNVRPAIPSPARFGQYKSPYPAGNGSPVCGNSEQVTANGQPQHGLNSDGTFPQGTTEALVKNIAEITQDIMALPRPSGHNTRSQAVHANCITPVSAVSPEDAPVESTPPSGEKSFSESSEESAVDCGTVRRIRQAQSTSLDFIPSWLQSPSPDAETPDELRSSSTWSHVASATDVTSQEGQTMVSGTKGSQQGSTSDLLLPSPDYVNVTMPSPKIANPRPDVSEPFPPYRDLMSGPQFPVRNPGTDLAAPADVRSVSSTAQAVAPNLSWRFDSQAPVFTPASQTMAATLPPLQIRGAMGHGHAAQELNKKPFDGKANGGMKTGGGKSKQRSKKAKWAAKNELKSADTSSSTQKSDSPVDLKESGQQSPATLEQSNSSSGREGPKDMKGNGKGNGKWKGKGKAVVDVSEKTCVPEKTSPTASTGAKGSGNVQGGADVISSASSGDSPNTSTTVPKKGHVKNKPGKKGGNGDARQNTKSNSDGAGKTTAKSTDTSTGSSPRREAATGSGKQTPSPPKMDDAADFPALPRLTPVAPLKKMPPALAPIPLYAMTNISGARNKKAVSANKEAEVSPAATAAAKGKEKSPSPPAATGKETSPPAAAKGKEISPPAVKVKDKSPVVGEKKEKSPPAAAKGKEKSPVLGERKEKSPPVAAKSKEISPPAAKGKEKSPVVGERKEKSPVVGEKKEISPPAAKGKEKSPVVGERKEKSPVVGEKKEKSPPAAAKGKEKSPVVGEKKEKSPVVGERKGG